MTGKKKKAKIALFIFAILAMCTAFFYLMLLINSRWYAYLSLCAVAIILVLVRQTKFWHGWRIALCWFFAIALSFTGLVFGRPDLKVSFTGTLVRESIRLFMQQPTLKNGGLFTLGAEIASKESAWEVPKGFTKSDYNSSKSKLRILKSNNESHQKLIYQLHGGGYVIGFIDIYRDFAVRYSKLSGGADVASLDYRIAPKNTYPAALEDAQEGWEFLLAQGYKPENIIIVGDSAGGNLALALVEKLRDEGKALPCAMVCMSPWADMADQGASHKYNLYKDPMFGIKDNKTISKSEKSPVYAGKTDLHDKYLSPVYGSFTGFPPMLLQVGTYEVLESDSLTVFEKAKAAGVDVKLTEYNGMFHVFQMAGNMIPESKAAWAEVSDFLMKQFNN